MRVLPTPTRLAAALLAAAALHGAPAAAADEPGWTAGPAAGRAATPRPYFYLAGAAGSVLEDRLTLANSGDRERTLTLRGADAYNTPDGALAVRPAGDGAAAAGAGAGAGAGAWISFGAATTVKVPPHTRAVVPFTVTVPPAAAPGDHPAAVVATEAGHEAAVRVHQRVGGPTLAALTVEDVAVHGSGGSAVIRYALVNRGNVALAPELAVRAEGRFGKVPGRAAHAVPVELLPGRRVELSEPWPGAPALDRVALTLTATAPGAAPATARASAWLLPGGTAARLGAGLLALGTLATAALLLVRTRRTRRERPPEPPATAAAPAPEPELTGASR
ncbi:hypothetical protein ACFXJO_30735 [Streptomyces lavendulae]|uniref:COG1470 family protein n=1 Tax=Streptomyces lavendulae TaxID=1914 RepID=UPI0036A01B98